MPKPSSKPDWTLTNPTRRQEPTAPKKETGWDIDERPPSETMNWVLFNLTEWTIYFEEITDALNGIQTAYDAVVGVLGTHATINDLMADANIAQIKRVLVSSPQTLTGAPQVIDQDDMWFEFKPQAVYSKGAGSTLGIQITSDRVTIMGGRFTNWSTGGDKAIELTAAASACLIMAARFASNDTSIDDLGSNNVLQANIEE